MREDNSFKISEQIRKVSKEISQFDNDFIKMARETSVLFNKREKRVQYLALLRNDLRVYKSIQNNTKKL